MAKHFVPYIDYKNDDLINCFSIQPIFSERGKITKSNVFSIDRELVIKKDPMGRIRYHLDNDIKKIELSTIHYNAVKGRALADIYNNSRHFQLNKSAEDFANLPNDKLLDSIKTHCYYLFYFNKMTYGNCLITSNKTLYDKLKFRINGLQFKKALVSKELLDENLLIIGAKGAMSTDCGIILCPIIDKDHYMEWLDLNGLTDNIPVDSKHKFPLLKKWGEIYQHYNMYLNENVPSKWYVSKQDNCVDFYHIIHFKKDQ